MRVIASFGSLTVAHGLCRSGVKDDYIQACPLTAAIAGPHGYPVALSPFFARSIKRALMFCCAHLFMVDSQPKERAVEIWVLSENVVWYGGGHQTLVRMNYRRHTNSSALHALAGTWLGDNPSLDWRLQVRMQWV